MSNGDGAETVRLGDYFTVLRRHWAVMLICLLLGVGGAFAYLHWAPKRYSATTAVLVDATPDGTNATVTDRNINMDTEAQLATANQTVSAAAARMHVSESEAQQLASDVSVSVPANTNILDISYAAPSARAAQQGATAFAQAYLDQRKQTADAAIQAEIKALQARLDPLTKQLQQVTQQAAAEPAASGTRAQLQAQANTLSNLISSLGNQQNQLQATIVSPGRILSQAPLPSAPSSPNRLATLAAGIVLGLLAGVGVTYLRHRADDVVRGPSDVYLRTRVPVVAVLSGRLHAREVAILPAMSADGRGYARLRNLVTARLGQTSRPVVVVAGVRQGGGPVAANLAASLARAGEQTYLLCADVFGPTTSALTGDQPHDGLAEILAGEVDVEHTFMTLSGIQNLRVVGSGRAPDRADALLQTRSPGKLVEELVKTGAYVVIEAPPTADSPDAQTLANVAELAVLVVEVNQTKASEVLDACAQFESMGTPVLGAVVARYGKDSEASISTDAVALDEPAGEPEREPATVTTDLHPDPGTPRPLVRRPPLPQPTPVPAEDGTEKASSSDGDDVEFAPTWSQDAAPR